MLARPPKCEAAVRVWKRQDDLYRQMRERYPGDPDEAVWDDLWAMLTPAEVDEMANMPCGDCGVNTLESGDYYMVKNEVWAAAGMDRGFLCVACLESRLGRELVIADFTSALVNVPNNHMSPLLLRRLLTGLAKEGLLP